VSASQEDRGVSQEIGTKYYEYGLLLLDNDRIIAIAYKYMNKLIVRSFDSGLLIKASILSPGRP